MASVQPKCAYVDFLYSFTVLEMYCESMNVRTYRRRQYTHRNTCKDTTYRIYQVLLNMVFNFLVRYR